MFIIFFSFLSSNKKIKQWRSTNIQALCSFLFQDLSFWLILFVKMASVIWMIGENNQVREKKNETMNRVRVFVLLQFTLCFFCCFRYFKFTLSSLIDLIVWIHWSIYGFFFCFFSLSSEHFQISNCKVQFQTINEVY